MRKQYHFRKSPNGFYAWDVDKLTELTASIKPKAIPVGQIAEVDENYWFEIEDDKPTCRKILNHMKMIAGVELRFPIILCPEGRLMDGMHRVAKAILSEKEYVNAVQFTSMPKPGYVDVLPSELSYD